MNNERNMKNQQIETAIKFYETRKNEILVNIDLDNSISADRVIKYGKELESIAFKLDALFIAKNN